MREEDRAKNDSCSRTEGLQSGPRRPHTEGHTWHQVRDDWKVPVGHQLVVRGASRFWAASVDVGDSRREVSSG